MNENEEPHLPGATFVRPRVARKRVAGRRGGGAPRSRRGSGRRGVGGAHQALDPGGVEEGKRLVAVDLGVVGDFSDHGDPSREVGQLLVLAREFDFEDDKPLERPQEDVELPATEAVARLLDLVLAHLEETVPVDRIEDIDLDLGADHATAALEGEVEQLVEAANAHGRRRSGEVALADRDLLVGLAVDVEVLLEHDDEAALDLDVLGRCGS